MKSFRLSCTLIVIFLQWLGVFYSFFFFFMRPTNSKALKDEKDAPHSIQYVLDNSSQHILLHCMLPGSWSCKSICMFSMPRIDSGFLCVVFSKRYTKIISAYSADPSGSTDLDALSTTMSLAKDLDLRVQFLSELYCYIQSIHRSAFQSLFQLVLYIVTFVIMLKYYIHGRIPIK